MAYVDSEVGRLRSVLLHRPGSELARLTPRNNDALLFDGIPWVARAQDEHDAFADALRSRGVEVLTVDALLEEALALPEAREEAIAAAVSGAGLGDSLRACVRAHLDGLHPHDLTVALVAGLLADEVAGGTGLVARLLGAHDFVVPPLPNLLFTRDSSVWVRDRVAVTRLAMPARQRETSLTRALYTYHPRFAGARHV